MKVGEDVLEASQFIYWPEASEFRLHHNREMNDLPSL